MASELTGRELDAAVAREIFGFTEIEAEGTQAGRTVLVEPHLAEFVIRLAKTNFPPPEAIGPLPMDYWVPHYSTNDGDRELIEDEIERRGLERMYVEELAKSAQLEDEGDWDWVDLWKIRRATPEQICLAALSAVRSANAAS